MPECGHINEHGPIGELEAQRAKMCNGCHGWYVVYSDRKDIDRGVE